MNRRTCLALASFLIAVAALLGLCRTPFGHAIALRIKGKKTVADRLEEFGAEVDQRLQPLFRAASLPYPPARLLLLVFKKERRLYVHAAGPDGVWVPITSYPVLGMSGSLGPKLREGDQQVPEGRYRILSLNPNSLFHVSLRLDYPNDFDRAKAQSDGRANLGGDIMIHGRSASVGCLAMGDPAAEDLFALTARVGAENVTVLILPVDFRAEAPPGIVDAPGWLPELYEGLKKELDALP